MISSNLVRIALIGLAAIILSGCGGGQSGISPVSQKFGSAEFTIEWPRETRLIPEATEEIEIYIDAGGVKPPISKTINRPINGGQQTIKFEQLSPGNYTITIHAMGIDRTTRVPPDMPPAFPSVKLASASAPLIIQEGQTTSIDLTLVSTIDHIELSSPTSPLIAGQTIQLTATAKNAQGRIVLLSAGKLQWTSSDTSKATVSSDGNVTGVAPGEVEITVTDTESGKSASIPISVAGAIPN